MDNNKKKPPRKQNDRYLKIVFEDYFADFLKFVFPDAEKKFDLSKKIEFMDKEFPPPEAPREEAGGNRTVDLLAKVQTHEGREKWILVHTEIEGGSRSDLPFRILEYWVRIRAKHKRKVQTVVFFTGGDTQPKPSVFEETDGPTEICFRYLTCDIQAFSDEELMQMDNPFSIVVLACRASLLEGKISDPELNKIRIRITKKMLGLGYGKEDAERFIYFLGNIIHVSDPETNKEYWEEIGTLTKGTIDMKTIELARMHGREDGIEEARKKAEEEKLTIALNLKNSNIPIEIIAKNVGLNLEEVKRL